MASNHPGHENFFSPECQVVFNPEVDGLDTLNKNCKKNPGHSQFIPVTDFRKEHLPLENRDEKNMELIRKICDHTVRVKVTYTSLHRPDTFDHNKGLYPYAQYKGCKGIVRYGTGTIVYIAPTRPVKDISCPCPECLVSQDPKDYYWMVVVLTATHVIYDDFEAERAEFHCFYDGTDMSKVRKLYGLVTDDTVHSISGIATAHRSDFCHVWCITHELDIIEKLAHMTLSLPQQTFVMGLTYEEPLLGLSVSHPHGQSKRITVGNVKHVSVPVTPYYTTNKPIPFCEGTSCRLPLKPWKSDIPSVATPTLGGSEEIKKAINDSSLKDEDPKSLSGGKVAVQTDISTHEDPDKPKSTLSPAGPLDATNKEGKINDHNKTAEKLQDKSTPKTKSIEDIKAILKNMKNEQILILRFMQRKLMSFQWLDSQNEDNQLFLSLIDDIPTHSKKEMTDFFVPKCLDRMCNCITSLCSLDDHPQAREINEFTLAYSSDYYCKSFIHGWCKDMMENILPLISFKDTVESTSNDDYETFNSFDSYASGVGNLFDSMLQMFKGSEHLPFQQQEQNSVKNVYSQTNTELTDSMAMALPPLQKIFESLMNTTANDKTKSILRIAKAALSKQQKFESAPTDHDIDQTPGMTFLLPSNMTFTLPQNAEYAFRYYSGIPGWFMFPPGTKFSLADGTDVLSDEAEFLTETIPEQSYVTYDVSTCPGSSGSTVYCDLKDGHFTTCFPHSGTLRGSNISGMNSRARGASSVASNMENFITRCGFLAPDIDTRAYIQPDLD